MLEKLENLKIEISSTKLGKNVINRVTSVIIFYNPNQNFTPDKSITSWNDKENLIWH